MKILAIDDDPNIIEIIQLTFELGWPEVKLIAAGDGETGINLVEAEIPNAVVLDLNLPDKTGFQVLREIRMFSDVPVLMLTVSTEEQDIVKALTWGANDYLTKPFRQMEFLARIKAITHKLNIVNQDMSVHSGGWHFGRSLTELFHGQAMFAITPVEGLILHSLIKRAGQYIDTESLITKVWGESKAAAADSLRVHIYHLRKKIGDRNDDPTIIVNKPGRGYMFVEETQFTHPAGFAYPSSLESTIGAL
jgi:two-component system KDP operon response regulator KdpE/two-component system response regulator VicR